jgi:hypothetical protein
MSTETALTTTSAQAQSCLSLSNGGDFTHIQRVAKMFSASQLVPVIFQNNIENVVVALEMAARMNASPLMVMQNLHVIHGKPTFSSTFNIASVNASGKFTPLRYIYVGKENTGEWGCYATAKAKEDGAELRGVTVTIAMANAEGWMTKNGSKWKTMPQLMLQYRAATWWTRAYSPELLMGMQTEDEVVDISAMPVAEPTAPTEPKPEKKPRGINALRAEKTEPVNVTPAPAPAVDVKPEPEAPAAAPEQKTEAQPEQPAAAQPDPAPAQPATEPELVPEPEPMIRVEIKTVMEIPNAKKGGGVVGPVCKLTVSGSAYTGVAYYNGAQKDLPAIGSLIDAELVDANLGGAAVKKFEKFVVVGG